MKPEWEGRRVEWDGKIFCVMDCDSRGVVELYRIQDDDLRYVHAGELDL